MPREHKSPMDTSGPTPTHLGRGQRASYSPPGPCQGLWTPGWDSLAGMLTQIGQCPDLLGIELSYNRQRVRGQAAEFSSVFGEGRRREGGCSIPRLEMNEG